MDKSFQFRQGDYPLVLSLPHEGSEIPPGVAATMTDAGKSSWDTDWFLDRLYDVDELRDASRIAARFSRYVIDLNRAVSDQSLYPGQNTTGLFPAIRFDQQPIYEPGCEPDEAERSRRIDEIWKPYHDCLRLELGRLRDKFGTVVLFEGHSIASQVPFLFEGTLPDLNFGTNGGQTCDTSLSSAIENAVNSADQFSHVFNGRFVGGYITREFGDPASGIHSVQLELSQATHLNESTKEWADDKVSLIQPLLRQVLQAIRDWIDERVGS